MRGRNDDRTIMSKLMLLSIEHHVSIMYGNEKQSE